MHSVYGVHDESDMTLICPENRDIFEDEETLCDSPSIPASGSENGIIQLTEREPSSSDLHKVSDSQQSSSICADAFNGASTITQTDIHIKVSLRYVVPASTYFRACLKYDMRERRTLNSSGHVKIPMDLDADAMLLVMSIIHRCPFYVPSYVSLAQLTNVAACVDYLDCRGAIESTADKWIDYLRDDIPTEVCRELIQWLCILSVFKRGALFWSVSRKAARTATGLISSLGLPIRDSIIDKINNSRNKAIGDLLTLLRRLREGLQQDCHSYSCEDRAIFSNIFTNTIGHTKVRYSCPEEPFVGLSIENLKGQLGDVENFLSRAFPDDGGHSLKLNHRFRYAIDNFDSNLGFLPKDFR